MDRSSHAGPGAVSRRCIGVEETRALARELATELGAGDVVLLHGDLGAGKTTFAQALCAALGVEEPVSSPTFALAHHYESSLGTVAHLDLHRLGDAGGLDLDLIDDELDGAAIALVEWPSVLAGLSDLATWHVRLAHGGPDERVVEIERSASAAL